MLFTKGNAFKEYLQKELDQSGASLSFNVKMYLVDLLYLYVSSDQLFEKKQGETKSHEKTLAEMYKKSQTSKPQEKLYLFKKMGDFSLYLSGFFRSAIKRRLVHVSYYEQLGQNAYGFVSSAYGSKPNVYKELSQEFRHLSQILFSIQKKSEKQNSQYLLNFTSSDPSGLSSELIKKIH